MSKNNKNNVEQFAWKKTSTNMRQDCTTTFIY